MAKALFLPLRVDAACNYLNRIIDVHKLRGQRISELKKIIQHLGELGRVRNDIVHLGAGNVRGKIFKISNESYARTKEQIRRINLSHRRFEQIDQDLADISFRLLVHGKLIIQSRRRPRDVMNRILWRNYGTKVMPIAWQYKPVVRSPGRRKRHGKPRPPPIQLVPSPQ
jgi:hypothetical protein